MTHTLELTEDEIYVITLALFRWIQLKEDQTNTLFPEPLFHQANKIVHENRIQHAEKLLTQLEIILIGE